MVCIAWLYDWILSWIFSNFLRVMFMSNMNLIPENHKTRRDNRFILLLHPAAPLLSLIIIYFRNRSFPHLMLGVNNITSSHHPVPDHQWHKREWAEGKHEGKECIMNHQQTWFEMIRFCSAESSRTWIFNLWLKYMTWASILTLMNISFISSTLFLLDDTWWWWWSLRFGSCDDWMETAKQPFVHSDQNDYAWNREMLTLYRWKCVQPVSSRQSCCNEPHDNDLWLYCFTIVDADEIKRLGKRFRKLDLDNSGSLSIDEFMSLPELQQNPLVQRVIDIFDTDGNGEVDFKGMLCYMIICMTWETNSPSPHVM